MIRKGFKTTEFYVALTGLAGLVWIFVQQNCEVSPDKIFAFAGIVASYIGGRSWVKTQ